MRISIILAFLLNRIEPVTHWVVEDGQEKVKIAQILY